jgi:hypothetical protein
MVLIFSDDLFVEDAERDTTEIGIDTGDQDWHTTEPSLMVSRRSNF